MAAASGSSSIVIGYKNTISGGSSIMQPIRIPENTRNVILVMNLILPKTCYIPAHVQMLRYLLTYSAPPYTLAALRWNRGRIQ